MVDVSSVLNRLMPYPALCFALAASHCPSGDQTGEPYSDANSVTQRWPSASRLIRHRSTSSPEYVLKAILLPSGDQAGAESGAKFVVSVETEPFNPRIKM